MTRARGLTAEELQEVLEHVARAGFDPNAEERAGGRLARLSWRGRVLRSTDRLPPAEAHYLRHVIARQEWPPNTTLSDYLESIRQVILDPRGGLLVCQFRDKGWHLAVVRRSHDLQGPEGYEWIVVEYRVATGHWMTAFQAEEGLAYFESPTRKERRWLRRPQ